jgi:hypothetical protein
MAGSFLEDDCSFTWKLEAKYGRKLLLMEDSGSFTWKLEAKNGRQLLPHGRRRIFYLETRSQIWRGVSLLMEDDFSDT